MTQTDLRADPAGDVAADPPVGDGPDPAADPLADEGKRSRLRAVLERATASGHYRDAYAGIEVDALHAATDLEALPILRKQDFVALQRDAPPFGGIMASGSRPDYLFVSPGPIHEPGFMTPAFWRMDRALRAAGFSASDIVHNTFSYHLTPGAWIFDSGARALGCATIPAGNAAMEQQIHAIRQYGASAYAGTPDFLKKLAEAYAQAGLGAFPIRRALVSGGAFTQGLQDHYRNIGIAVSQCYATAELGLIACDVADRASMRIDDDLIVEIVDPATGRGMPHGATGEVVVTTLRDDYPLIRFGTGDLSAFAPDVAADGAPALVGWLGRSDQAVKVRGMFVRPQQLEALRADIDGLVRLRLVIDRENEQDSAVLFCGFASDEAAGDTTAREADIAERVRRACHVNIRISIVDASTIVDDGKLIVDIR